MDGLGHQGLKILVLSKKSLCLLILREVASAQYLPETAHGVKVPWIQEWPVEERLLEGHSVCEQELPTKVTPSAT